MLTIDLLLYQAAVVPTSCTWRANTVVYLVQQKTACENHDKGVARLLTAVIWIAGDAKTATR